MLPCCQLSPQNISLKFQSIVKYWHAINLKCRLQNGGHCYQPKYINNLILCCFSEAVRQVWMKWTSVPHRSSALSHAGEAAYDPPTSRSSRRAIKQEVQRKPKPKVPLKPIVVMIPNLSSLVALQVVITTTCGAASADKVGIIKTPGFEFVCSESRKGWLDRRWIIFVPTL